MDTFVVVLILAGIAQCQAHVAYSDYKPRDIYYPPKQTPSFSSGDRIVGGLEAGRHQFPYQVALLISTKSGETFFCGGSLISNTYVLTAAHCVDNVGGVVAVLGAHRFREHEPNQIRIPVSETKVHENWNSDLLINDIAIVKLSKPVETNAYIQIIALPSLTDIIEPFTGKIATLSGWGRDSDSTNTVSQVLRFAQAPVISNLKCEKYFYTLIKNSHICVDGSQGKSICNGDSGGPLVVNGKCIGISSFVSDRGCEKGFPSVFTRVTSHLEWILENTDAELHI